MIQSKPRRATARQENREAAEYGTTRRWICKAIGMERWKRMTPLARLVMVSTAPERKAK